MICWTSVPNICSSTPGEDQQLLETDSETEDELSDSDVEDQTSKKRKASEMNAPNSDSDEDLWGPK